MRVNDELMIKKAWSRTILFIAPLLIAKWEWIVIALVVLLLFGGKKIPELMKGLGKGVKSFKQGMNEMEEEVKDIKKDIDSNPEK